MNRLARPVTPATLALAAMLATSEARPAAAQGWTTVTDEATFVSLVQGRELRIGLFGISLTVSPAGTIGGTAQGRQVTGEWAWQDGLFCRDMTWGQSEIGYDCQLVQSDGGSRLRFVEDAGAGRSADFNLR